MMKHYKLLLLLLCVAGYSTAQVTFRKAYGTLVGQTLPHPSGGFISVTMDGILRTASNGNVLWAKSYSPSFHPNSIDFTAGGYIISGQFVVNMSSTGGLIKTDTSGNITWGKKLLRPNGGYYLPVQVKSTSDGGYVFCGQYGGDGFVTKTDVNGDTLWTQVLPFSNFAWGGIQAGNVRELPNGDFASAGYILTNTGYDPWLVRLNANGDTLWTRIYHSQVEGSNEGNFHQLSDGGFMVMGGSSDGMFHIRTDSLGIPVWAKSYGLPAQYGDASTAMVEIGNQYTFIGFSHSQSFSGSGQPVLFATDTSGNNVIWKYIYNLDSTAAKDITRDLRRTPDGGYVFGSGALTGIVKTNALGIAGCSYDTLSIQIINQTITLWSGSDLRAANQTDPQTYTVSTPTLTTTIFCENPGNIKGIEENELQLFSIAPNPADENVTLHFSEQHPAGELLLMNVTGQIFIRETIAENEAQFSLNTSKLSAGCYFLRMGTVAVPLMVVR